MLRLDEKIKSRHNTFMTITYHTDLFPSDTEMSALMNAAWDDLTPRQYSKILDHGLGHICAKQGNRLVGFVNIAWDGGSHAFILDTTVHPEFQRRGIATKLVKTAIGLARDRGAYWLHVDYEPHLSKFYEGCGFRPSAAGVLRLSE